MGGAKHWIARWERIVLCEQGHLYRTIWIPGVSLKAIRRGSRRYQSCPVGRHQTWVERVDPAELSPDQLSEAKARHDDLRIP